MSSPTSRLRGVAAALGGLMLAVTGVVATVPVAAPSAASTMPPYDPGMIISDALFYDGGAMTSAQIQQLFDYEGRSCRPGADGTPCLKDYRQDTFSRAADDRCPRPYAGAVNETAAQIIAKAGAACGISQKAIVVMLQKEQSLVTATGSQLYATRYRSAMGFGCPDTAPCDARYYGFYNQVYQAAWQLKNYALNPTRFAHRAGVVNQVRYHPNTACGSAPVLILNKATAGLYNYTPYQPNAAALAAGYGTGDACSAYGNRNFHLYYNRWFGSANAAPIGVVDSVTATNTTITVTGWTFDPDATLSNDAHIYVDGVGVSIPADQPRPDVGAVYGRGPNHGFSWTGPARPGPRQVCVYGTSMGYGDATLLGCRTVIVPDEVPLGEVEVLETGNGQVTLRGWSFDPDSPTPNEVHVYIDGVGTSQVANEPRPDIAARYGRAETLGFTHTRQLAPGTHQLCVYSINTAPADNRTLLCRSFVVSAQNSAPLGVIDAVQVGPDGVTVTGWAFDPDTTRSTDVHIYIDGAGVSIPADRPRPDVGLVYGRPGTGSNVGYSHTRRLGPGQHSVCVFAINATPGDNTLVGCHSFTIANATPFGVIDEVTTTPATGGQPGTVTVSGWTLDPDTTEPTEAHIYIGGAGWSVLASDLRPDVAAVYGRGDQRGYRLTTSLPAGPSSVCVFAINTTPGDNYLIGCRPFTVPAQ